MDLSTMLQYYRQVRYRNWEPREAATQPMSSEI